MNNQKQIQLSIENSIQQPCQQQFLDPIHTFPYQLYSSFWPFPFYNVVDHAFLNQSHLLKFQQQKLILYNSVTTQTSQSDFSQQNSKIIESLASEAMMVNEVEKNKSIIVKQENEGQQYVQCVKIEADDHEDSSSESIKKQQNFHNNINKNLKSKQQCLQNLLQYYLISPQKYQSTIEGKIKKQTLFSLIVKFFNQKICMFKKSKEEMIKLIIRKTQRCYKLKSNCKKDQRFKKYGGFKSMNSFYLEKIFSDAEFSKAFLSTMENFIQEFEEENHLKLSFFLSKVCSATNWEQFKLALKSLDEKNKMPWPTHWILKLKKVIDQLQGTYIDHHVRRVRSN